MKELLINIIHITLGKAKAFPKPLTAYEWESLFAESQKHTLIGFVFSGIERLPKEQYPPLDLLIQWYGLTVLIEQQNHKQINSIKEINEVFNNNNLQTCVLKGQGVASLYPNPFRRQCGDVDLWVKGERRQIIELCSKVWGIDHADIKNIVTKDFSDVHLEVHFIPSWFYNPFTDKTFRQWYRAKMDRQFLNKDGNQFCHPTIQFNLVYSAVHIYKHLFDEGIGLRQILDYYFIIMHSARAEREEAFRALCGLRMKRFIGAVMYVLKVICLLNEDFFLTPPNSLMGEKMLSDILRNGNFGHYDERNMHGKENRIKRGFRNIRHNSSLLLDYPSEVIWSPVWKCWHWWWRKRKGYL